VSKVVGDASYHTDDRLLARSIEPDRDHDSDALGAVTSKSPIWAPLISIVRLLACQAAAEAHQAVASDHSKDPTGDEIER
jgi:hypothetical protein